MLSHYEVNKLTGEKFLRLAVREWKTSYDPEIKQARNDKKSSMGRKDKNQNVKEYEIHSLKFYKFDEELQEFTQEDQILYDISSKFLDLPSGGYNNDFFLTKNEHTYYYQKDAEKNGF